MFSETVAAWHKESTCTSRRGHRRRIRWANGDRSARPIAGARHAHPQDQSSHLSAASLPGRDGRAFPVDLRIADWNMKLVDTVADNASAGLFTLGCETQAAAQARPPPVRHGDRKQGRADLCRRWCRGDGQSTGSDAVAGAHHGARRPAAQDRRRGDVGLARADDAGIMGRRGRWRRISGLASVRAAFAKE